MFTQKEYNELIRLLKLCDEHTKVFCKPGAATRLEKWEDYIDSPEAVGNFIGRCLQSKSGQENGKTINLNGGISLENIVALQLPHCFPFEMVELALYTLGKNAFVELNGRVLALIPVLNGCSQVESSVLLQLQNSIASIMITPTGLNGAVTGQDVLKAIQTATANIIPQERRQHEILKALRVLIPL